MRDKAELEFERVYKKHKDLFKSVNYHYDAKNKFTHAYVQLQTGVVVYLMKFNAPTKQGTNVEVMNKFEVLRADILNGSFSNSINGFIRYGSNDKLSLIMGLGYVTGDDVEIETPKMIGNVNAEEMMLSTLLYGWIADSKTLYRKRGTPTRKTDDAPKQRPAGIGATKKKKEEVVTWVFSVHEIVGISERSGAPIFAKGKEVKVRRAYYDSAQNFVKHQYSYQKTKKHYFVELQRVDK